MKFIEAIRGVFSRMFSRKTITEAVDVKPAMSDMMAAKTAEWMQMYSGNASWIDNNNIISLRLESAIVREFATISIIEMETSVSDEQLNDVYQKALRKLNQKLQRGLAAGAMCIRPLADLSVEYIPQGNFIPIRYDDEERLVAVIFPQVIFEGDVKYTRLEYHDLQGERLHIQNLAYMAKGQSIGHDSGELGVRIPLDTRPEWADLAEDVIYTGVKQPIYGYFVTPIDNTIDNTPAGMSMFCRAEKLIQQADTQFARILWEFESGERAVHVDSSALATNDKADPKLARLRERLYRAFDMRGSSDEGLFEDYSPTIRDESLINGLDEIKREIEFSCGLAYGDLSDPQFVEKTATEIVSAKKRKYDTVTAIQENLSDCLEGLAYALAFYAGKTNSGYEFTCSYKDSILTDEEAERAQDVRDISIGIMRKEEYRAKWYGETEEEALSNLPEVADVIE